MEFIVKATPAEQKALLAHFQPQFPMLEKLQEVELEGADINVKVAGLRVRFAVETDAAG